MKKFFTILAGLFFAALIGSPVISIGAESPALKELVQKAKKEGRVEIWTPMEHDAMAEVLKGFEKKYGIKTAHCLWRGTATQQRTFIELRSNRTVPADVLAPARESQEQFETAALFQKPPYEYLKVWPDIDKRQIDPSGLALNVTGNARAVAYNPTMIPENLVPKTWDDCARPELKGKVVLDSRNKLYALQYHRPEWFRGWVKRMVANDVKLIRGQTEIVQLVSAGAHAVFCSAQTYSVIRMVEKGAKNVKLVVPKELLLEAATTAFIVKGAKNPHAAQLLVGWLTTDEGQALLDKEDYRGFPWVKGTVNAELAKGKEVLFCDPKCADAAGKMAEEFTELLGLPVVKKKN
jgi:ABC-type Fe3+ transport system substrate-binding protein